MSKPSRKEQLDLARRLHEVAARSIAGLEHPLSVAEAEWIHYWAGVGAGALQAHQRHIEAASVKEVLAWLQAQAEKFAGGPVPPILPVDYHPNRVVSWGWLARHNSALARDRIRAGQDLEDVIPAARESVKRVVAGEPMRVARESVYDSAVYGGLEPASVGVTKWARVAEPGACGFCAKIATGVGNFKTTQSASLKYHPGCRCHAVPEFSVPEGYKPQPRRVTWHGETSPGEQTSLRRKSVQLQIRQRERRTGGNRRAKALNKARINELRGELANLATVGVKAAT